MVEFSFQQVIYRIWAQNQTYNAEMNRDNQVYQKLCAEYSIVLSIFEAIILIEPINRVQVDVLLYKK